MTRQYYTDRRTVLKTIPATAIGSGVVTGTASAARGGVHRRVHDENTVEISAKHDEEAEEHELNLDTDEMSAGWTTLTFDNETDHTHFVYVIKLPQSMLDAAAEADADVHDYYYEHATRPFQYLMDQIVPEKEPDPDDLSDKYSNPEEDVLFPPWLQEIQPSGGVGLTSPNRTATTTLGLAPGEYFLECYVKDDDEEFHSYNGMSAVLSVTDDRSGEEPEATIDISLASAETGEDEAPKGTMDVQGDVRAGTHTVAVHYEDQQAYENLGGHDVHLIRLDAETNLDDVNNWMNWMEPGQLVSDGSEPGTFLGGVHEIFTPELLGAEGDGEDGDGSNSDGGNGDGSGE